MCALQIMHGYSGATVLHVHLCLLFQIIHKLRRNLVDWLESENRRGVELQEVLNLTYEAATGHPIDGENFWARMREQRNRGRYAMLESESDRTSKSDAPPNSFSVAHFVNEEDEATVAELNLQVLGDIS